MNTPKPWTYYNDNKRCGIVLGVEPEYHFGGAPPSSRIQLASHGAVLCVSTGDVLVKAGETAYIRAAQLGADMQRGWTNDVDECLALSAGVFTKALRNNDATDGSHMAIVRLGGSLFPESDAELQTARNTAISAQLKQRVQPTRDEINAMKRFIRSNERSAEHEDRARTQQTARVAAILSQPYQRVHIDWTDAPAVQSVEITQALAFMRYVELDRKLREIDGESDAADALRDEMDTHWYAMSRETRELAAWAIAEVRSTSHEQTSAAAAEPVSLRDMHIEVERVSAQAPTEPAPRDLVLQPLDEPAAAYWHAIKTTRDAIDEARVQLDRARTIRNAEGNTHLATHAWFDNHLTTELLLKLRKALPDMPATSASLDGGCANGGDSGC